ncbi:hypothetical protein J7337_011488 [Fusarium musae]|uniref:BTB domain-containing protein n=1 Tax=Fusarium musae TaxID=1042133 RepID=A0A9P8D7K1_9HYPO|nr:hypothetical protein J7337_011488 [Fusarium musae]KAG9496707.1 hypothetical protein J7337_011488 [Fusarium musae]
MPIPNPNPESSTTRPDSNQSMPDQEGTSLVERIPELETDIVSGGDLVLIVGADRIRIRITEQAARVCSDILAGMLDQQNITNADNTGRVRELELPNDNPTTVRNAFGSIYPGNPHTDDLWPAEIYDVVVFAREYKMIPEFKKVAPNWFRTRSCGRRFYPVHTFFGLEECWYLMMAAHYMRLGDHYAPAYLRLEFSKLSERLVKDENPYHNARLVEPGPDAHEIEVDIYRGSMQQKWNSIVSLAAWEALDHASD